MACRVDVVLAPLEPSVGASLWDAPRGRRDRASAPSPGAAPADLDADRWGVAGGVPWERSAAGARATISSNIPEAQSSWAA